MKASVMVMHTPLNQLAVADRPWIRRMIREGAAMADICASVLFSSHSGAAGGPPLQAVDGGEHHERHDEHDDAHRRGAGIIAVFQFALDEIGGDLRFATDAPGDKDDGAVFPNSAGKGEGETSHER